MQSDLAAAAEAFAGAEGDAYASPDALDRLHRSIDELLALQDHIDQIEGDLAAAKAAANKLKTRTLPDIMSELRIDEIIRDGRKIAVSDFVSGSLPNAEEKPVEHLAAIRWLEEHDGEGIIKTEMTVKFGRSEHNLSLAVAAAIKEEFDIEPEMKTGVHAQTLQAFAREKIRNGDTINPELLGLYTGTVVKITKAPKGKTKK